MPGWGFADSSGERGLGLGWNDGKREGLAAGRRKEMKKTMRRIVAEQRFFEEEF